MSELNSTLLSVLLILGCGLVVAVIFVITRISKTIGSLQKEMTEMTKTVVSLADRINSLAESLEESLAIVNENRQAVTEALEYVRSMTRNVHRLQQLVMDRIEPPLVEFASLIGSVMTGVRTFTDTWRKGR